MSTSGNAVAFPERFRRHNRADPAWLQQLPDLIHRLCARWSLIPEDPFPGIEINYVAPATRLDGSRCVLKVSRHLDDTRTEIAALRLWDGQGAARLLEAEPADGALLLERLEPGTMLAEAAELEDDAATVVAATMLRQLWRPALPGQGLQPLAAWCAAFDRNRAALSRGSDGFPAGLFQRADALRHELLATTDQPTALHGDLHHFNILRAGRAEWLAIDPKGLVGDRCFDVCQFFKNPGPRPISVNRRRLDIFCTELGLDRERTKSWCLVHAVLDACWDFEEGNRRGQAIPYAEEVLHW